jgi:hypothetical protein
MQLRVWHGDWLAMDDGLHSEGLQKTGHLLRRTISPTFLLGSNY